MGITIEGYVAYATQAVTVVLGLYIFFGITIFVSKFWGAPWVISSKKSIRQMLTLAQVQPGETVLDLGAGDGRILITAIQEFQAKGIGIEIDPFRCLLAHIFLKRRRLNKSGKVIWGDIFSTQFPEANVITLFLTRDTNLKLKPILEEQLKPGTRIVSNGDTIPGWTASKIDNQNLIFLYVLGETDSSHITEFVRSDVQT
ncbi:MAG: class I SAM-dependent methyltransferase [Anaerolineales bacterium]